MNGPDFRRTVRPTLIDGWHDNLVGEVSRLNAHRTGKRKGQAGGTRCQNDSASTSVENCIWRMRDE
ncbi:UNVERIFIED_ORG: hypothetical protein BDU10_5395 [Burkholderia sp. CF145]